MMQPKPPRHYDKKKRKRDAVIDSDDSDNTDSTPARMCPRIDLSSSSIALSARLYRSMASPGPNYLCSVAFFSTRSGTALVAQDSQTGKYYITSTLAFLRLHPRRKHTRSQQHTFGPKLASPSCPIFVPRDSNDSHEHERHRR